MKRPARLILIFLLPMATAMFVYGMARLFQLRFESGDVYPAYSSLRTDPLGVKAFYASLEELDEPRVERNFQPFEKLPGRGDAALLVLGVQPADFDMTDANLADSIETYVRTGGRLVVTFFPVGKEPLPFWREGAQKKQQTGPPGGKTPKDQEASPLDGFGLVSLCKRWGVELDYTRLIPDEEGVSQPITATRVAPMVGTDSLSWHTALYFTGLDSSWKTIYAAEDRPVIVERKLGRGSIVLSSDSYFLSNEAMRKERHPPLLAWLIGPCPQVIFDETHLGIAEHPGVMTLARRYRLHGLFAGLLALVGLYLWKSMARFVPPWEESDGPHTVQLASGKDDTSALVNLLQRNISSAELGTVCFREWERTCARTGRIPSARLDRIRTAMELEENLPARERNPVELYNQISRIIAERN